MWIKQPFDGRVNAISRRGVQFDEPRLVGALVVGDAVYVVVHVFGYVSLPLLHIFGKWKCNSDL